MLYSPSHTIAGAKHLRLEKVEKFLSSRRKNSRRFLQNYFGIERKLVLSEQAREEDGKDERREREREREREGGRKRERGSLI